MGAVALRHIHELRAEIADAAVLIDEVLHGEVARHAHLVVSLHKVQVAVQHTANVGRIGNDGEYALQVEVVKRGGDVLLRLVVLVVRIDLHTCSIVGFQHEVGRHAVVATQEHVVVVVHRKLPVAQHRVFAIGAEHQAVALHRRLQAQPYAQLALVVVETGAKNGATVLQHSIDECVERVLRILLVVAHLCLIRRAHRVGANGEVHGVEQHAIDEQRLEVQLAVQAVNGRRGDIAIQVVEAIAVAVHDLNEEVVAAAAERQPCVGEHTAQAPLVDESLVVLPFRLSHELVAGIEQALVVAGGIEVEVEVAAVDGSPRLGVRRQCVDPHIARTIGLRARRNCQIAHVALHLVVMLQVTVDVEVGAAADGEHAVGDAESPQVSLVEIHHDGAAQTLLAHQRIDARNTLQQVVVAGNVGIAATVAHAGVGLHTRKVVAGIAELLDIGLRRKRGAR